MSVHSCSYGDFSLGVHKSTANCRVPLSGTVEVTWRCNLNCVHCCNNLPASDKEARSLELTVDEYRRLLDQMAEAGCLWLLFTGGEPFLRPDFLTIYREAKKRGFLLTVFTNGTRITPAIADFLAEWPPFRIEITFHSLRQQIYEQVSRVPGSFKKCLRGIELLRQRHLPLALKTVAMSFNHHDIGDLRRHVEEQLQLPFRFDALINPRIDCSHAPLSVRLSPRDLVCLDLQDQRRLAELRSLLNKTPAANTQELYQCGGGLNSFGIDPRGRMRICTLSHAEVADLRAVSFSQGWQEGLARVLQSRSTRSTKCSDCRLLTLCDMCPTYGELENADPEEPVDFLCKVAHLRAAALGSSVPLHGDCCYCSGGSRHLELQADLFELKKGNKFAPRPARDGVSAPKSEGLRDRFRQVANGDQEETNGRKYRMSQEDSQSLL